MQTEEVLRTVEKPLKEEISVMDEIRIVGEIPAVEEITVMKERKMLDEYKKTQKQPFEPDNHYDSTQTKRLNAVGLSDDDSQSIPFIMKEKLHFLAGDIRRRTSQVLN